MFRLPLFGFARFGALSQVEGCNINAHAGSRTRVTSMGGLYDAATLHAQMCCDGTGRPRMHEPLKRHVVGVAPGSEGFMNVNATRPAPTHRHVGSPTGSHNTSVHQCDSMLVGPANSDKQLLEQQHGATTRRFTNVTRCCLALPSMTSSQWSNNTQP